MENRRPIGGTIELEGRTLNALKTLLLSWKTSLAGAVGILFAALAVWREGMQVLEDPTWQSVIVISLGLLAAKDQPGVKNDKDDNASN